ncbi:MAG TPA: hypothetical protein VJ508_04715, partial [Saprospiraceae bacterium]|nr:hypothetical protein [Saprospiraceae bacterium]
MLRNALLVLVIAGFMSCVVDEADLSKYKTARIENLEEAHDIDVNYSDSSFLVFNLKAPLLRRVYTKFSVVEEFPKGIAVTFYDRTGKARSWLTADFARRDQANRTVTVQKNVVLRNDAGDMLNGPEL